MRGTTLVMKMAMLPPLMNMRYARHLFAGPRHLPSSRPRLTSRPTTLLRASSSESCVSVVRIAASLSSLFMVQARTATRRIRELIPTSVLSCSETCQIQLGYMNSWDSLTAKFSSFATQIETSLPTSGHPPLSSGRILADSLIPAVELKVRSLPTE
jgi:hypothetical protein